MALSGLLLVLEGFVLAAYAALPAGVPNKKKIKKGYRLATWATFGVLAEVLVCAAVSLLWLLTDDGYWFVVALFLVSLLAVFALAGGLTWKLVD